MFDKFKEWVKDFTKAWQVKNRHSVPYDQNFLTLPENARKTSEYLYQAGFFGSGSEADFALGQAQNITSIARAFSRWPASRNAAEDQMLLSELLAATGADKQYPKGMERMAALLAHPVTPKEALESTRARDNPLQRVLEFVSFGRLGATKKAAEQWADVVAVQNVWRAIDAFKQLKSSAQDGMELPKDAQREMIGLMTGKHPQHGHRLQSALYMLEHPDMFESVVRQHRDLIEDAARQPAGKELSFGEVLSRGAFLRELDGDPMEYGATRAVVDSVLLTKNADRMRLVAAGIPDTLQLPKPGELDDPIRVETLRRQLHDLSEAMGAHTLPERQIPKHWENELRLDAGQENPVRDLLNHYREVRMQLSDTGYGLSRQAHDLSERMESAAQLPAEQRVALWEEVSTMVTRLQRYREVAQELSFSSYIASDAVVQALIQDEDLAEETALPIMAYRTKEQLQRYVPMEFPKVVDMEKLLTRNMDLASLLRMPGLGVEPVKHAAAAVEPDVALVAERVKEAMGTELKGPVVETTKTELEAEPHHLAKVSG